MSRYESYAMIVGVLLAMTSASCATIVSGTTQGIKVTSTPPGAAVTVEPGGMRSTTPDVIALRRKDGPYRMTFEMDGYEPYAVTITSDSNGWIWGNLLIGGIIGIIIDSSSGAALALSPEEVHANLISNETASMSYDDVLYVFAPDGELLAMVELE